MSYGLTQYKRIVNVIPLTRVGLSGAQIFSYLVPIKFYDQLRPGQLVSVPFGRRQTLGVTTTFEMHRLADEVKNFKELEEIKMSSPVLSEKALALANWIARYYICSVGQVLKLMLPKITKRAKDPEQVGYEIYNPDFVLTEEQRRAVTQVASSLGKQCTILLNGVTGSGKTEVYLQSCARVLEQGRQALVMVPEISLTPQAVERFARRFGIDKIALWHSGLSDTERYWNWEEIRQGRKSIVIGPRSAVFSPFRNLALIIMDEEHDSSFKQYDQNPKYHAREVASKLSELWNCPLVLGDATPSVESYYQAVTGNSVLLSLPYRIKIETGMPQVKVVDMREELRKKNFSLFSEDLQEEILRNLDQKKQIILFLNRRGAATFVMCRDCGFVIECPNCATALVWHEVGKKLLCHHCGEKGKIPTVCPNCGGTRIKDFGAGTQRVQEELEKFLKTRSKKKAVPVVARLDSDTTAKKDAGAKIYKDWAAGKIEILIGTQMIAKGWDIKNVGLVGIVSADSALHLPDFRSGERAFQLLTQVAGRTGRGSEPGTVVLQTYRPDNYAIEAAKLHDYEKFFKEEVTFRRKYGYPPFVRLIKITAKSPSRQRAEQQISRIFRDLLARRKFYVEVLGPAPAFIDKIRGKYQYQLVLKIERAAEIDPYDLLKELPSKADIDVDPESLL